MGEVFDGQPNIDEHTTAPAETGVDTKDAQTLPGAVAADERTDQPSDVAPSQVKPNVDNGQMQGNKSEVRPDSLEANRQIVKQTIEVIERLLQLDIDDDVKNAVRHLVPIFRDIQTQGICTPAHAVDIQMKLTDIEHRLVEWQNRADRMPHHEKNWNITKAKDYINGIRQAITQMPKQVN